MKFQKGNKLGGRKNGSKNKISQAIRDKFLKLLEDNMEKMKSDLNELEPKDRIKLMLDIASFCVPKLKAIEYVDRTKEPIDIPLIKFTHADYEPPEEVNIKPIDWVD